MPGPPANPVLGHLRRLAPREAAGQLRRWADVYGPIFRCRILHRPLVVVSGASLIREIVKQRPTEFRRAGTIEAVAEELGINGVFSAEGDDWRRQRRIVNAAFSRSKLTDTHAAVAMVADRLLRHWDDHLGQPHDVFPDLKCFTADVTTLFAFGFDLDSINNPAGLQRDVEVVFNGIARRLFSPLPYWRVLDLPRDRDMKRSLDNVRHTVQKILREGNPEGRDNLLRRMQQARDVEGSRRGLSETELFANVIAALFGGEDTTANTLGWILHFLATHPEAQEALRAEVDGVLGEADAVDTAEKAGALRLVTGAFIEALRLRPVTPVMFLAAAQDVQLAGYDIPAGTDLFLLLDYEARSKLHYDDPDRFDPTRWTGPKVNPASPSDSLFPFGGGPRICPGHGLAALEVQTLIGTLLRRYRIERAPNTPGPKQMISFTAGPDRVTVTLRRREAGG